MTDNDRQQRMVERIQEDERLRGDLEDPAAAALVAWASEQVREAAADPARSDEVVEAEVKAIRAAARAAARSGEQDPQRVVAQAQAALAQAHGAPAAQAAPVAAAAAVPATPAPPPAEVAPTPASAASAPAKSTPPPADAASARARVWQRRRRGRFAKLLRRLRGER